MSKKKPSKPSKAPSKPAVQNANLTVPQRIAAIMGTKTWTAGELVDALESSGDKLDSNNLRGYVSTTLNSACMNLRGSDDVVVKYADGKPIKVHMFKAVARGQYRVATAEDVREEAHNLAAGEIQPPPPILQTRNGSTLRDTTNGRAAPVSIGDMSIRSLFRELMRDELQAMLKTELQALLKNGIGG